MEIEEYVFKAEYVVIDINEKQKHEFTAKNWDEAYNTILCNWGNSNVEMISLKRGKKVITEI